MCSIIAHGKQQPTYFYYERSGGGRPITKNETTEALEALCATLNFIDCWLKFFHHNSEERYMLYYEAMKKLFKILPTMK